MPPRPSTGSSPTLDAADFLSPAAARPAPGWQLLQRCVMALGLLLLLRWAAPLLVPVAIALALTLVFSGPVEWLARRRVPVALAALGVVGVTLLCAVGATLLLVEQGVRHWDGAAAAASRFTALLDNLALGQGALADVAQWLRRYLQQGPSAASMVAGGSPTGSIARTLWQDGAEAAVTGSAALLLLFFMLISQRQTVDDLCHALPTLRARRRLLVGLCECQRGVGRYLWVMAIVNLGLAAAGGLALAAIGLPQALLWAIATFVLAFVPYLGPLAVTGLLLLAGATEFGASLMSLTPPIAFLVLHGIEANLISPWLMGRQLRVSRLAVLLAVMTGAWCWGLAGGLLAVPMLIAADAALRHARGFSIVKALLSPEARRVAIPSARQEQRVAAPSASAPAPGSGSGSGGEDVERGPFFDGSTGGALLANRPLVGVGPPDLNDPDAGRAPAADIERIAPVVDRAQPQ